MNITYIIRQIKIYYVNLLKLINFISKLLIKYIYYKNIQLTKNNFDIKILKSRYQKK